MNNSFFHAQANSELPQLIQKELCTIEEVTCHCVRNNFNPCPFIRSNFPKTAISALCNLHNFSINFQVITQAFEDEDA